MPAEKLERSLEVVGNRPLYEAAKDYPVDAWRVWTVNYPREYGEDSEVCDAGLAKHQAYVVLSVPYLGVPQAMHPMSRACLLAPFM